MHPRMTLAHNRFENPKDSIMVAGADPGFWNGGVNFCNNVIEPKPGWGVWGLCISMIEEELRKRGVKIHPFHLPWIRVWVVLVIFPWTRCFCGVGCEGDKPVRIWRTRIVVCSVCISIIYIRAWLILSLQCISFLGVKWREHIYS